ncbi:CipC-like antibiotic stress responsive protein [Pisolithus thermaeus]|nr:CipC-like antibiotic stress responsive protein [Pisolithus croceorrhizus]KAI6165730.1 CipC-like antibiotic stress responsive protein [Pisolithus thermaeus]
MGFAEYFQNDHGEVHSGNVTHDLLAGAVAYEAAKAYEDHLAANGRPDDHAQAKELIATLVAGAATHLVETKGRDAYDRFRVEHDAKRRLHEHVDREYQ